MMAWVATVPQPVISSSRATTGSAPGAVAAPGPVVPSAPVPCAAGIASISSLTRADSWPVWAVRAPVWSRMIRDAQQISCDVLSSVELLP